MQQLIENLRPFMFNGSNLNTFPSFDKSLPPKRTNTQSPPQKQKDLFIPKYKDTLFWSFYIIAKGWENFYLVGKKSFSTEKEYKILCIEKLRNAKELLKKNRWRKNQLENDLLNNKIISTQTFICLCALHNINIILMEDYYYYSYTSNETSPIFFIKKSNNRYGLYTGSTAKMTKELEDKWEIYNLKKPLRGISSYKVGELKKICKQIHIDIYINNRICNKQDIYKLIQSKLNKDFLY